jgi:alcohol dehydrogenase
LRGFDLEISTPVPENPEVLFVQEFSEQYRGGAFDSVIGIGGGSVIDAAKMTAVILACETGTLREHLASKKPFKKRLALGAIPTTAGTGSEVTPYASLSTEDQKKITVTDPLLFPDLALLDPVLTHSMPARVTASTGMDALSQAIEAFWSVHHTGLSDTHALRAASLVSQNLRIVVREPGNAQARFAMALGSCESGLAIAQTATTAVHSVSYPITEHFGVPHGHACALTLAEFIRFNEPSMRDKRYESLWSALDVRSASAAAEFVETLMENIGLERRLSKLGIDREGVRVVLQNGFRPDRVKNNPRELTPEALNTMLMRIL